MHEIARPDAIRTVKVFFDGVAEETFLVVAITLRGRHTEVPGRLTFIKITQRHSIHDTFSRIYL